MKVKIPYALKMKFISMEGLNTKIELANVDIDGKTYRYPAEKTVKIEIDLNDDPESLECCSKWLNIIITYFKTSYKAYRINIGPYDELWPISIDNGVVTFTASDIDFRRKSWKEWFLKEDYIYAPK